MFKLRNFTIQTIEIFKSKTIKSISIILSANAISAVVGFFITIMALRGLDEQSIGVLFPLVSLTLMIKQFTDFGLNTSFIINASGEKGHDKAYRSNLYNNYFWIKVLTALVVTIIGMSLSLPISNIMYKNPDYQFWVSISFAFTFFQISSMYFQSTLQIQNIFIQLSITKIIPQIIKLLGLSILLYISQLTLKNAFIFYMGIPLIVLLLSLNKDNIIPILQKIHLRHTSDLFRTGKWIWISMIAHTAIAHSDIMMTRAMVGDSELAKLIAGQRLASVIPLITGSLVLVLLPKVSSTTTLKELQYFVRKVLVYMPIIFICILLVLPFSPFITKVLLGERYFQAAGIFNIYLVANSIGFILTPLSLVLYKLRLEKTIAIVAIVQLLFNLVGNYYFIPIYGATASATITLLCKLIAAIFYVPILYKFDVMKRS